MTTIQETVSTSGNSAPAFDSDEQLIDAVSKHLGRHTAALRAQLPTCTNHSVSLNIDVNMMGEPIGKPDFTAFVTYEGEQFCGAYADEAEEAIFNTVTKARQKGAYYNPPSVKQAQSRAVLGGTYDQREDEILTVAAARVLNVI